MKWFTRRVAARPSPSFRPTLEELESRLVLSPLTPVQVRHAYGLDQASYTVNGKTVVGDGTGQTIAIVDAYHDANAWSDLQTFDKTFGLNDPNFRQAWYTTTSNDGWSVETMLDVEWAHAIAPKANILLVEAASSSLQDMFTAVNYARQQAGVSVVSMSWGGNEWSGETGYDATLTTPSGHNGVTFVASTGDVGAAREFPALSPHVVAVGGTNLSVDVNGNYLSESAWSLGGGGVSSYEKEPGFQTSVQSSGRREGPDVAYNSSTGVYEYWTRPSNGQHSWLSEGGTSAGAPQWAAIIAIGDQIRVAGGAHTLDGPSQTLYGLYADAASDFHDVTTGSNGYAAHAGYDLATGRGTPYAQRIILDLARINDSFHGAVTSAAGTASAATASLFAVYATETTTAGAPGGDASAACGPTAGAGPGAFVSTVSATTPAALDSNPGESPSPGFSDDHASDSLASRVIWGGTANDSDSGASAFDAGLSQEEMFAARLTRWGR